MRFREEKVVRQELVWIEWEPHKELVTGGKFKPIEVKEEPSRVWTLTRETSFESKPTLPIIPVHGHNAFWEDNVHDWRWRNGHFRYHTRVMNCSCWVLLEYTE